MQEKSGLKMNSCDHVFSGNIFIFHAFDVGDDIHLEKIEKSSKVTPMPLSLPKYFKKYHEPLAIQLPNPSASPACIGCKIHSFGAVSLTYKIPFHDTLENLKKGLETLDLQYQERSITDVKSIFDIVQEFIAQPKFFQTRSSYLVIQVHPEPNTISLTELKDACGGVIASALRFETKVLSEYQKNEILQAATGYFRGDLIIIDSDAAFVYDEEYEDHLDIFEFANIQLLELRYFDRVLDQQLNSIYEGKAHRLPIRAFIPLVDLFARDPLPGLGKLKADISVIVERLEDNIKIAGQPYIFELYTIIEERLDLKSWYGSIDRKLAIIRDIQVTYQHKTEMIRENMLSVLIVILIFIELVVGILNYLK
jgi:hypothetical protein